MEPAHIDVTKHTPRRAARAEVGSVEHSPAMCRKVTPVLQRIGDKWSILIVMILSGGPRRFNELKRRIDGISQRMLTLALRGLERDGLVTRTVTPSIPPRVDYELTPLGMSLCEPVAAIGRWASENYEEMAEARAAFDARQDEAA